MPSRFLLSLIALVLCVAGLQICADTAIAGFVPPRDRLSIAQPNYSGLWKGPDLSVEYRYSRDQSQIDLSGKVRFAYFWIGYTLLENFQLRAVFLDKNGRVLESDGLVTNRDSFESIPFSRHAQTAVQRSLYGLVVSGGSRRRRQWTHFFLVLPDLLK